MKKTMISVLLIAGLILVHLPQVFASSITYNFSGAITGPEFHMIPGISLGDSFIGYIEIDDTYISPFRTITDSAAVLDYFFTTPTELSSSMARDGAPRNVEILIGSDIGVITMESWMSGASGALGLAYHDFEGFWQWFADSSLSMGTAEATTGDGKAAPVPEPATMLLLASGLVGLAGLRKKLRNN